MSDAPSLRRAALPLGALALAMAAGFTAMGSFGTVQDAAKAELHLTDATLALVQGVAAAVPLALFSVPLGRLVDRTRRVRLLVLLAALWTAGELVTAYAPGAGALFVARMMTGIGTTGAATAALSLAADLCAPAERGRAMLIVTLGKTLGIAAGFALTGWLFGMVGADAFGLTPWRAAHVLLAIVAAVALLPLFLLNEPPRREVVAGPGAPFGVALRELWERRGFLLPLFLGQVSVVMADNAAVIWSAPVLGRSFHLRPDQFAGWMGILVLGSGLGGAILGGFAADAGQKAGQRSGRRGGVLLGAVIAAMVGAPCAVFPIMGSVPAFAVLLGLLILCGTVTGLVTSVTLTVLLPNEVRGLAIGLFIAVAGVIGYGVAPSLVTAISSLLGGEAQLAPALAIVGTATGVLAAIAFRIAQRRAPLTAVSTD